MTTSGIFIMIASVGTVTVMFGWCIWKVLVKPDEETKIHSTDFETPDIREDA
jgi:hypothetical protein